MNLDEFGNFLKTLREEKGLTQGELAEKILVDRTTVNKWEKGKSEPVRESLILLGEYFDVTLEELMAGKRIEKEEERKEVKDEVLLGLMEIKRKYKRRFKQVLIVSLGILLIFLVYYFFTTYNSIQVYKLYGEGDHYKTRNGIMIVSNEKTYFRLGGIFDLEDKIKNVDKIKIYVEEEEKEKIIVMGDANELLIEKSNNVGIFDYLEINEVYDEIYLTIYEKDKEETIQLKVERDFENKGLLFKSKEEVSSQNNINNEIKLSEEFEYDESIDVYKIEKDSVKIEYYNNAKTITIMEIKEKNHLRYKYDFVSKLLNYTKYDKRMKVIEKYEFNSKNLEVLNREEMKVFTEFEKNYLNKYFSEIRV